MPQIKVNEIDQSVVTRVVSDDKVKILVPIIASFGPTLQDSDDGEPIPVNTFTDITDFNRMYGYTEVEFNPFKEEYSRNYAAQLIQKGAAVSVVKVNKGDEASFDLGSGDRSNPSESTVCPASKKVESDYYDDVSLNDKTTFLTDLGYTNIVPETVSITFTVSDGTVYTGSDVPVVVEGSPITTGTIALKYMDGATEKTYTGTITYASGAVAWSGNAPTLKASTNVLYNFKVKNFVEGTFCPQIASIKAKYDGSFGNDLLIGITQLTTSNVSQAYQYANISVYRAIKNIVKDASGNYVTVVSGISVLETKRVTTDPDSPYYFEDVDFDFIKITGTDNAREELKLVWSNISANPESDTVRYSGFPTVRVRYTTDNGSMVYNVDAMLTGGSDFAGYSQDLLEKLRKGFKGYYTSDKTWTLSDVYAYQVETYGSNTAVVPSIYNAIVDTYKNFKDPYVYDFDFITSGGFVYTEYGTDVVVETPSTETTDTLEAPEQGQPFQLSETCIAPGTLHFTVSTTVYKDSVDADDPYKGNISENGTGTTVAYVNYATGELTNAEGQSIVAADVTVSYKTIKSVKPQLVLIPKYFNADKVKASYYDEVNPIHSEMRNLVETRQDCIALFDVPYDYDTTLIVDYSALLNTSYGTIHHPWCWVQHPTIASKQIRMSPSYIFLYTFLSNLIDNVDSQKWFPPAGVKRATARVVKRPDYEIGSVILNMWQNDNISRVNPIMKLKQYGYVIYGQYTTLQAIDLYTHSALESLNVRLISNVVKKKIFDVCLNLAFEPNTSTLWLKFYAQMDEFLRYMKYNDGVYDYKIKMDESTVTTDDINHLRCPGKVWIAPTRTAEFFDIDFIITEAGALFPED